MGSITIDGILVSVGQYIRCLICKKNPVETSALLEYYEDDIPSEAIRCEVCESSFTDTKCVCCQKIYEVRVDEPSQYKTLYCVDCRGWHRHT